jgi:sec-independent protein translocase protein TatA
MLLWIGGGTPGWPELVIIVLVIMLLFGAKRLPELARSLGKSISEFKKGREESLPEGNKEDTAGTEKTKETQNAG